MKKEIEISIWWKSGEMLYKRDCLSPSHPEHTYNYIVREFNVNPEDYGIENPLPPQKCPHCGKEIEGKVDEKNLVMYFHTPSF